MRKTAFTVALAVSLAMFAGHLMSEPQPAEIAVEAAQAAQVQDVPRQHAQQRETSAEPMRAFVRAVPRRPAEQAIEVEEAATDLESLRREFLRLAETGSQHMTGEQLRAHIRDLKSLQVEAELRKAAEELESLARQHANTPAGKRAETAAYILKDADPRLLDEIRKLVEEHPGRAEGQSRPPSNHN